MSNINEEWNKVLVQAMGDTFEGISFSEVIEHNVIEEPFSLAGEVYGCALNMEDPLHVCFTLYITKPHVVESFEAISGLDPEEFSEELLVDFVRELTNTAAGHLSNLMAPNKKDMIIGLPENVPKDKASAKVVSNDHTLALRLQVEMFETVCTLSKL